MNDKDKRPLFKFYRSYYDVACELSDKDRLAFYDAVIKREFTGEETELKGMAKFAYISQKHNIDAQINGWIQKTGIELNNNSSEGASVGGSVGGSTETQTKTETETQIETQTKTWRDDFEIYKSELRAFYLTLIKDKEFISQQEKYYPSLDIILSIEKACTTFWATEAGWRHKKKSKSKEIDWKQTLINAIGQSMNKVYKPKT